ncbi:hypothetical protein [Vibrio alginolyticus]|uniref:hypothetical protein n=1 Tax=Vibrio alginolyticus TaxID=663 RepID=UPI001C9CD048|nr:hypothetical protein [Vibrio alginolyticus]MBY7698567.1 hypothetical protein [Vibrio alginolyticus]
MKKLSSSNTPLDIYHGVPKGWTKEDILTTYELLSGKKLNFEREATEPGSPSWLPDRYNWLQYRAALYKIADGVREGDEPCIEIAIRYIELNYFGSYSGFIRERFARLLKSQKLTKKQAIRLNRHFQMLIDNNQCFKEFRVYKKLRDRILKELG